ncbi:MAG: MgtC/SapB family protein [Anaerolineae bacterium]
MYPLDPILLTIEDQLIGGSYIILAAFMSTLIGLDRERNQKSAGLRTHMLTGVAACLFTLLSLHAFPYADTSRVASNVVTGIGFLGAGIIIQRKRLAHDLTTAVSIWVTAAIGMAIGAGLWLIATIATLVVWFILAVIRKMKSDDDFDDQLISEETAVTSS